LQFGLARPADLPHVVPPALPWRRPRWELLLLGLLSAVLLTRVYPVNDGQDVSRLCLTRALVHLRLSADDCLVQPLAVDRSAHDGHLYSDKAPGLSILEIPSAVAVQLPNAPEWPDETLRLWPIRLLSTGLLFLLGAFLVGRISEGLASRYGGLAMVGYGLGTLVAPFAAANFDHVPAGVLGLAAFALAWARRPGYAGLVAGAGLLVEYESFAIFAILGLYVALQNRRSIVRYLAGALPAAALLGAYERLGFGAPWHPCTAAPSGVRSRVFRPGPEPHGSRAISFRTCCTGPESPTGLRRSSSLSRRALRSLLQPSGRGDSRSENPKDRESMLM
jgi:hypothetical protein